MLFSIIVPVYNAEDFLEESLLSVLRQTFNDFELIVVDDGSTDRSFEIAKSITDKRITVLHQENGRQGKARNFGLKKAVGDYVLFLDADDTLDAQLLHALYKHIESSTKEKDIYFYDYRRNYNNQKQVDMPFNDAILDAIDNQLDSRIISNASPCLAAYSRKFLQHNQIQFIENVYFEDISFMVQTLSLATTAAYIPGVNYNYLIRNESTVRSGHAEHNLDVIENFKFIESFLKDRDLFDQLEMAFSFLAYKYIAFEAAIRTVDSSTSRNQQNSVLNNLNQYLHDNVVFDRKNTHFKASSVIMRVVIFCMIKRKYSALRIINRIRRIKG